ncbi:MFS transporter [Paucisalibacillus sp. EB02]|uniref:MFS transporter n=1 Tax=Paucisalibacillus sp. EB02 TaxID=1347087 RepID=UPI0006935720|nr:MFS transporter [Paucisalibacillus sp. EB02]
MNNRSSFRSIWLGNATSELGGALFTACNSILIYQLTGSATALGSVWLVYYIPSFLMQLFIGPYVDRWSRKWIMINCQFVRMILASILLISIYLDTFTIAFIFLVQVIVGVIMPIFAPANQAILRTVIEREYLSKANASLDSTRQVMVIMGPVISGVFVDYLAVEWVLLIITVAFLLSSVMLLTVNEDYQRITIRKPWIHEFREGLHTYFNHRLLVWLGVFFGFVQFGVGVTVVTTLPFITATLDQSVFSYGIFMAGFPIGYLIGAFIQNRLSNLDGVGILFTALFIGGCTYLSLGITPWYVLAVGTEIIAGIVIAIFNIYNITLIQQVIPNHLMGKVTSVRLLIMRTMMPLGILFAMVTVPFIAIRFLYVLIGSVICITALGGYLYLRNKNLMASKV